MAVAVLTGCGFAPVYGTGGPGNVLLNSIAVAAPQTRDEQILVREIETRLGRPNDTRYTLSYTLNVQEERMAISATNITTRFNLVGHADYALTDTASEMIMTQGSVNQFTGYSTTGTTVATLAAERDAHERLAKILADQIVTRLIAASPGLTQ
ncbi:LPS assembly lipoprotein LptE [Thalassovita sp.]|uniref:LPS assembly lipoprotein LptE n=1 Tax=Thalassovita sp. TaxID=1979401 RepID=UPI002B277FAB|nr:LPS assembly lipoprotein LptE [Thalassovita sp.]